MKTMIKELKTYADLANKILNNDTVYSKDKRLIKQVFNFDNTDLKERIRVRLTLIDSYYSTNMSRRYYGIESISELIYYYYPEDALLINDLITFLKEPFENNQILDIFNQSYGISKKGEPKEKAISLISKYAYFLTGFYFPIYDRIVFETYQRIQNKMILPGFPEKLSDKISEFILIMNNLNLESGINDFNKLDNFLWLTGRIIRGNVSLILHQNVYMRILENLYEEDSYVTSNVESKMAQYLFSNRVEINELVDKDIISFIDFRKQFTNYCN